MEAGLRPRERGSRVKQAQLVENSVKARCSGGSPWGLGGTSPPVQVVPFGPWLLSPVTSEGFTRVQPASDFL